MGGLTSVSSNDAAVIGAGNTHLIKPLNYVNPKPELEHLDEEWLDGKSWREWAAV